MLPSTTHDLVQAAIGGTVAIVSWTCGQLTPALSQIPDVVGPLPEIIKTVDTPLVIVGMGYAIWHLWKSWQAERKARLDDIAEHFRMMKDDAKAAAESRERLVQATTLQTEEFKALRRTIEQNRTPLYQKGE